MEPREAAEVLALMRGTWPRLALDEVANQLWLDDLVKLERREAIEAFRSLRDTQDRAPSWALFRDAYGAQRARYAPRREAIAAPARVAPTDEQRERIGTVVAELKDKLTTEPKVKNRHIGVRPKMPEPSGEFDPLTPMLTYDEVYAEESDA